jgi:hypothetical protein
MMSCMYLREPTPQERAILRKYEVIGSLCVMGILAAVALWIWAGCILAWQSGQWLDNGRWPAKTWADGFAWLGLDYPLVSGVGTQKIVDWFLSLGLWSLPFLTGVVVIFVSGTLNGNAYDKAADARRVHTAWKRHLEETRKENPQPPEGD